MRDAGPGSLENLPDGLDGAVSYQWVDLDGEGISGRPDRAGRRWFYKRNLSAGRPSPPRLRLGALEAVARRASRTTAAARSSWTSPATDSSTWCSSTSPLRRLLRADDDGELGAVPRVPAPGRARLERAQPALRRPHRRRPRDLLITEDDAFVWYPSLGEDGLRACRARRRRARRGARAARWSSPTARSRSSSPTCRGDGLTDLVRVRNGEVCYWPNLGYGRFGAKVTMDDAPRFDDARPVRPAAHPARRHRRLRHDRHHLPRPRRRAALLQPVRATPGAAPTRSRVFPRVDDLAAVSVVDLLGNGTACLVWSSPLPGDARPAAPLRRPDGRPEAAPAGQGRRTTSAPRRASRTRPRPSSTSQDKPAGRPGSRACRSRSTSSSASRRTTASAATASSRATPTTTATSTATSASSAASAWSSSGTPRSSRRSRTASCCPTRERRRGLARAAGAARRPGSTPASTSRATVSRLEAGHYVRPASTTASRPTMMLPDAAAAGHRAAGRRSRPTRSARPAVRSRARCCGRRCTRSTARPKQRPPVHRHRAATTRSGCSSRAGRDRHAVFFTHARETVDFHYERNPDDPRIVSHDVVLEVDAYGNVALRRGRLRRTHSRSLA